MDLNLDILREKVAEYCSRNEVLDLKKFLHYYTIDVLGELVWSSTSRTADIQTKWASVVYPAMYRSRGTWHPDTQMSNLVKSESQINWVIDLIKSRIHSFSGVNPIRLDELFTYLDVIGEFTFSKDFGFLKVGRGIGDSIATNVLMLRYIIFIGHFYRFHDFLMMNSLIEYLHLQPAKHIFQTAEKAITARENEQIHQKDMMGAWRETLEKHPERMTEQKIDSALSGCMGRW